MLTFGNTEIKKNKFHHHKTPIFLGGVDIEKLSVFNKIPFGEKNYKHFIGYLYNNNKVKPLNIMLPKTSVYVKSYVGKTKWMYFLTENVDFLQKYNTVWDKVSADIKKNLIESPSIIKLT